MPLGRRNQNELQGEKEGEVPWKSKVGTKGGIFGLGLSVPHENFENDLIAPVHLKPEKDQNGWATPR
jgi:hypothetical protein